MTHDGGIDDDAGPGVDPHDGRDIGWPRGVASGVAILLVGFVVAVDGANTVATRLTSLARSTREYLATALFVAVVVGMAWALRRLQARRLI